MHCNPRGEAILKNIIHTKIASKKYQGFFEYLNIICLCTILCMLITLVFHFENSLSFAAQQDYLIGPQDELRIEIWDHPDLTRDVSVSLSGSFTFPLIGEVKAADRSTEQVQREITKKLADGYLINPQVTVTITAYRSKQVNILGEVNNPGTYPYTRQTSLIELISTAGGLTNEAGPEAYILRSQENNPVDIKGVSRRGKSEEVDLNCAMKRVDLTDLPQTGQDLYILLKENDTIYIPRADFFYVLGEVNNPGQYKLEKDTTVLKAISTAGGHTKKANLKKVVIVRELEGNERELQARLSDPVMPDDIIKVPESFF